MLKTFLVVALVALAYGQESTAAPSADVSVAAVEESTAAPSAAGSSVAPTEAVSEESTIAPSADVSTEASAVAESETFAPIGTDAPRKTKDIVRPNAAEGKPSRGPPGRFNHLARLPKEQLAPVVPQALIKLPQVNNARPAIRPVKRPAPQSELEKALNKINLFKLINGKQASNEELTQILSNSQLSAEEKTEKIGEFAQTDVQKNVFQFLKPFYVKAAKLAEETEAKLNENQKRFVSIRREVKQKHAALDEEYKKGTEELREKMTIPERLQALSVINPQRSILNLRRPGLLASLFSGRKSTGESEEKEKENADVNTPVVIPVEEESIEPELTAAVETVNESEVKVEDAEKTESKVNAEDAEKTDTEVKPEEKEESPVKTEENEKTEEKGESPVKAEEKEETEEKAVTVVSEAVVEVTKEGTQVAPEAEETDAAVEGKREDKTTDAPEVIAA